MYGQIVETTEGRGRVISGAFSSHLSGDLVYEVQLEDSKAVKMFYCHEIEMIDTIVEEVREDLKSRSQVGIKKYNTTLDRKDLGLEDWVQHLYEELLDATLYIKRLKREL